VDERYGSGFRRRCHAPEELNNERLCRVKRPGPVRIAQLVVGALAVAAIALTFAPKHQEAGDAIVPVPRRTPMPDFTMSDLRGGAWSLSAHRGRVVLVNFWATWCPPCREEIPGFIRLAKSRGDLDIAGIAMDDGDAAGVRQFAKAAGVTYPVLLPSASSPIVDAIQSLPTTLLVDKMGRIAKQYIGEVSERTVREDVDRLMAEL